MKKYSNLIKLCTVIFILFLSFLQHQNLYSQTFSSATSGSGSGYSVIERDGFGIENPDCKHKSFGPHITQSYDNELKKNVFIFHSHINADNDRCAKNDRVRIEIKGGPGGSSTTLRHTKNSSSYYRWKFRLDENFKGSNGFCHIFQLKAKGGDDGFPVLTITPRANTIQLIHNGGNSGNTLGNVKEVSLSDFKGQWIEGFIKLKHSENGSIDVTLKKVSNGQTLLSYSRANIDLWRKNADYNRPKWGIYRKKINGLKDEQIRFADWCISESSQDQCPSTINNDNDNTPPSITLTSPSNNSYPQGTDITINFNVDDNSSISKHEVFVNNELKDTDGTTYTPYILNNLQSGSYKVKVVVTDNKGNKAEDQKSFTVTDVINNQRPLVSFVTPSGNISKIEGYDSFQITVNAIDSDGTIAYVKLFINDKFIRQEVNPPYTWGQGNFTTELLSLPIGEHTIKAEATDNEGQTSKQSFKLTVVLDDNEGNGNTCDFGTPSHSGLAALENLEFSELHILGSAGPNLDNFRKFSIHWNPVYNGLYKFAINTNNGFPDYYVDFSATMSYQLSGSNPEVTLRDTGFSGLDDSYWVTMDEDNLVMVSKDSDFTLYFSNDDSLPECISKLSNANMDDISTKLYPNPVDQNFTITHIPISYKFSIYNLLGTEVMSRKLTGKEEQLSFDVSNLAKGLYIIKLMTKSKETIQLNFFKN